MLHVHKSKRMRMHTPGAKGGAISRRRVSLHASRSSRDLATRLVPRSDAHALLATMHQRRRDMGLRPASQADGWRASSMPGSTCRGMGSILSGRHRFRHDHRSGICSFHSGQSSLRDLVDEAADGHPGRFWREFVHGNCKRHLLGLDGKSSEELWIGIVDTGSTNVRARRSFQSLRMTSFRDHSF
jgi:hypothetical protein